MRKDGRNENSIDIANVTTYAINSATATTIFVANPDLLFQSFCLDPDITDVDIFLRPYPAAQDNIKRGDVLTRDTFGNSSLFRPYMAMPVDCLYKGEWSAISLSGTSDLHVIWF